jgi:hypothetical protein
LSQLVSQSSINTLCTEKLSLLYIYIEPKLPDGLLHLGSIIGSTNALPAHGAIDLATHRLFPNTTRIPVLFVGRQTKEDLCLDCLLLLPIYLLVVFFFFLLMACHRNK